MKKSIGSLVVLFAFAALSFTACKQTQATGTNSPVQQPRAVAAHSYQNQAATDQAQPNRQRRKGPPPEALDACKEKAKGDECSFTSRRGEDIKGTCQTPRGDELVCFPEGGPRGRRGGDDQNRGPGAMDRPQRRGGPGGGGPGMDDRGMSGRGMRGNGMGGPGQGMNNRGPGRGGPPEESIQACDSLQSGAACQFDNPWGQQMNGTCQDRRGTFHCVPERPEPTPDGPDNGGN